MTCEKHRLMQQTVTKWARSILSAITRSGTVVNPRLVERQPIRGANRGIGETRCERVVYDENGQLLTGSFMDYAAPRRTTLPLTDEKV